MALARREFLAFPAALPVAAGLRPNIIFILAEVGIA